MASFELKVTAAAVGGDDEVRPQPRRERLHQNMRAPGLPRAAARVTDGPAHRVSSGNRNQRLARLERDISERTASCGRAHSSARTGDKLARRRYSRLVQVAAR